MTAWTNYINKSVGGKYLKFMIDNKKFYFFYTLITKHTQVFSYTLIAIFIDSILLNEKKINMLSNLVKQNR